MQTLEPLEPTDALTLYLSEKRTEVSDATLYSHKSRLGHFIRWCNERDIDNLNELTGRDIHRYKLWRRDEGNLNAVTLKTQMDTLRVFIRWCESVDGVPIDLSTKVQSPVLTNGENERDVLLDKESAEAILVYLDKYDYASIQHVTLALLWHTMIVVAQHGHLTLRTTTGTISYSWFVIDLTRAPLSKTSNVASAWLRCPRRCATSSMTG